MASLIVAVAACTPSETVEINAPPDFEFTAPGPNPQANTPDDGGNVAGFWQGLWHGIISPATLILSFLRQDVRVYEVHNNTGPYDLAYLLGVALVFSVFGLMVGSRRRL
jgi:hypothetical protein